MNINKIPWAMPTIGKEELSGLLNLEVKAKEQARQMVAEAQKAMDELAGYH